MTAAPPASSQKSPPRCSWRGWLAVLSVLLALLAGTVWLLGSAGGMRAICRMIEGLAAGQLTLTEPAGTLRGPFSLQSLRWRDETLDLQVQDLQVDWHPVELLRGRLAVGSLKVASLRVAHAGSSEATRLPDNLAWPLSVEVGQLSVGRIEVGEYAHPDGKAVTVAEAVEAPLSSDGLLHRLPHLQARIGGLKVVAEASLAAEPPFALTAKAGIEGDAAGRALAFDLTAEGRLEDFVLQGRARAGVTQASEHFAGEIAARITPFSPQPVLGAVIQFSAVDPAAWIDGAPQAALDLRAELEPLGKASAGLGGRLTVVNRRPGPVDRQRLPVASLQADLALEENGLHLANLDARLSGGGRLQGSGRLHADELALRLAVTSLDASALYSSLRRTQLAGPLRVTLGLNRQRLETELHDAHFSIHSKLAIHPDEIAVETLRLLAGDAQLLASGQVARSESGRFAVQGTLQNFDPSRFAKLPAAHLNAEFAVQGSRHPQLALALSFQLKNSRLGKAAQLAGNGEIDLAGQRLRKADVELTAAGNRLSAKGTFGAVGDQLTVLVAAPRLDPLGIAGELNGRFVLSGSMQVPEVSADLQSAHLALPGFGQLRGLTLSARLGNGNQGELSGMLRLAGLDLSDGESVVRDVMIDAEGVRSQHRLHAQLSLPAQGHRRELRLLLAGGFAAQAVGMTWAGTL
ncbi:hypothetical protein, partial [Candidatus Accumulibacter vicinus]|uniref:hypothetical protein n=1 Tax=Candidatus Accumulibacter vicinus TaxID=2954382 RepID=UPI00235B6CC6